MIKIGLDFAFKTCGIAILESKKLTYDSFIITAKKLSVVETQIQMVEWIWHYINPFLTQPHQLIIEDVFSGINPKASINSARSQGDLIGLYVRETKLQPKLIMASSARKNIGINCRWSKAQLQLWIIDKFQLGIIPQIIRSQIITLPIQYEKKTQQLQLQLRSAGKGRIKIIKKQLKEIKTVYNSNMGKLSTELKQLTKVDEHCADAIILALQ